MSTVKQDSLAAGVFHGLRNEVINPASAVLARKIVLIGVADATKLAGDLAVNELRRVFSPEEVGAIAGEGTMIHRLAIASFKGSRSLETWIIPQAEGGSDVAATGTITFTASSSQSGIVPLYIDGVSIPVTVATGDDEATIAAAAADAINADANLAVSAAAALGVVTVTSKSKGAWGNDITVAIGLGGETIASGVTAVVVDMASGAGVADIQDALDVMGEGDQRNELHFTALNHGYGKDTATLNAISQYVGEGGNPVGCYDKINGRFFRSLVTSVADDLAAEVTFADGRVNDRANGVLAVPNTPNNPHEIAALAMGYMEAINSNSPEGAYFDIILEGVFAGASNWTKDYDSRDVAVKSGISPTVKKNGALVLQNVVTFYRPQSIPAQNNMYRSMRNISILQNIDYVNRGYFSQEEWQNITIVKEVNKVANPAARKKCKDIQSVKDAILYLGGQYLSRAMIFSLDALVEGLGEDGSVKLRTGGTGFDYYMKVVLSGEGGILNSDTIADINFGV
jgi:phage tail sheath gpL-like